MQDSIARRTLRRLALPAAVLAVAGTMSIAHPSDADAASPGSVTASEGMRVIRAADKQRCLTLREVRHLVHGRGIKAAGDYEGTYQTWKGKGKVSFLDVNFHGRCADGAWLDYDNGRQVSWIDWTSPTYAE